MAKKVVLVTGASRGIGKAIAVKFAKKGYNVIINCAHREQELMQTKKEIESYQVTCTAFLGDMGDMSVCEQMFSMIRKQFGSLAIHYQQLYENAQNIISKFKIFHFLFC